MQQALAEGFLVGFALAFLIGPVFFLLIDISINKGLKEAVAFAAGVMLSDAMCAAIAQIGLARFANSVEFKQAFGLIGGIILIIVGVTNFFKKPSMRSVADENEKISREPLKLAVKGFALNTFNPFALIFWLGVSTSIAPKNFTSTEVFGFYAMALLTVLLTDTLKSIIAEKLQRVITESILIWMNRISGIALLVFGIDVIYRSFFE